MTRISQRAAVAPLEVFKVSTDISLQTLVGAKFDTSDGREFQLVQNAGTALASGKLVMGPKPIANHQNLTTSTAAVGATQVTVTLAGTLATANQYQGGYVIFNAGTGIGQTLKIASHPAGTANGTVVLTLEDPIQVATAVADTKSCLRLNPFGSLNGTDYSTSGVTITDHTALTGQILGVSIYPIAASTATVAEYGLIQTRGLVGLLNDATTAQGLDIMPSANTDGAVQTFVAATATRVGVSTQAGVTTEVRQVNIQL